MTSSGPREVCHVCGSVVGVRRPMPGVPPTCPVNECMLATAGIITVEEARKRLRAKPPSFVPRALRDE